MGPPPPIWLDEHGQPRPTRPCPRCGAVVVIQRWEPRTLRMHGWQPWGEVKYVNWRGHAVEVILAPEADGWYREIPILGEAA